MKSAGHRLVDDVTKLNSLLIHRLLEHSSIEQAWYYNGAVYGQTLTGRKLKFDIHDDICSVECRTKHPGTKHPMPFFATADKTSRIYLSPRTKHPMQFLSPRTKHPMPFLPPRTKHPMSFLPPRTKHPTLCFWPMKVPKTSQLVNRLRTEGVLK